MIDWTTESDEITQREYGKWKSKNEQIQVRGNNTEVELA